MKNHRTNWLKVSLLVAILGLSACGGGDDDGDSGTTPPAPAPAPAPAPTPAPSPTPPPAPAGQPFAVDTQFGQQGSAQLTLAPHGGQVTRVLELPDGKLLLLGHRQLEAARVDIGSPVTSRRRPNTHLFAQRLLANGQPDASFGDQGTVTWSVAGADTIEDAIALSDGTVALTSLGSKSCWEVPDPRACVVNLSDPSGEVRTPSLQHLLADGRIDRTGHADGHTQLPGRLTRLTEANGHVLVLSTTSYARGGLFSWVLSRHAFNGQIDTSFGTNGQVASRCETDGAAVRVDASQSIWVAGARITTGYSQPPASLGLCMERLQANGSPHASMAQPVTVPMGLNLSVADMRVLPDQRVLVAGTGYDDKRTLAYAVSFGANGQLTTSYGQQGVASLVIPPLATTPWSYRANAVIGSAGAVLFSGNYAWPVDNEWRWQALGMRFTAQGQTDTGWGQAGLRSDTLLPGGDRAELVRIDSNQRWLVQSSNGAAEDQPLVVTLTRLHGVQP